MIATVYGIGLLASIVALIICAILLTRDIRRHRAAERRRNRRGGYLP